MGLGHMGLITVEKKYRYESKSGLGIGMGGVAAHNGRIR